MSDYLQLQRDRIIRRHAQIDPSIWRYITLMSDPEVVRFNRLINSKKVIEYVQLQQSDAVRKMFADLVRLENQ